MAELTCENCENECEYCGNTFDPKESGEEFRCEECITNDRQVCEVCDEKCDEKPCDDKFGYEKICDGETKYKIYKRGIYCLKCSPKCICCEKYFDPETSETDDICEECCEKGLDKCEYCQEVVSKGYTNKHASFACIDCVIDQWQKS